MVTVLKSCCVWVSVAAVVEVFSPIFSGAMAMMTEVDEDSEEPEPEPEPDSEPGLELDSELDSEDGPEEPEDESDDEPDDEPELAPDPLPSLSLLVDPVSSAAIAVLVLLPSASVTGQTVV